MMHPAARFFRAAILPALVILVACVDGNPAGLAAPEPELPPSSLARLTCTANVQAGTVTCDGDGAGTAPGVPAAIIGGQGVFVRVASSGASYDGTSTFRVNVTVENLTPQALGTADGITPSASGVRVFFLSGPTVTGGTGSVEVANADGEAFYTAADQKYFQWDGILAPGDTTEAKEWRFTMPNTVTRFSFLVYVAAPVRAEGGWVGVLPVGPSVAVGDTTPLSAAVRNMAGGVLAGAPVTWSTSDGSIATVDAQGGVTGVGPGTATVTATSGGRTGSVQVVVHDAGNTVATVDRFEILDPSVQATGADSLRFRSAYSGGPGLGLYMEVVIRHPGGGTATCRINNPTSVPNGPMEWRCPLLLGTGVRDGIWRVEHVVMSNRRVTHAELLAAGAPAHVQVHSPTVDVTAPTLDSLGITQDTVTADSRALTMTVVATDDLLGSSQPEVWISSPGNPRIRLVPHMSTLREGRTIAHVFQQDIPHYFHGGTFVVDSVRLRDFNENRRTVVRTQLDSAGFRTSFEVVSPNADTVPPEFTHYSFSPDTVVAGVDTLKIELSAFETVDEAGVRSVEAMIERADDVTQTRLCRQTTSQRVTDLHMACGITFTAADAGTWRVRWIRAIDHLSQIRVHWRAEIAAVPLPTEVVVIAP